MSMLLSGVGKNGAAFSPTSIATQVIDFSALSTLFTDTTRTTPVANDGDTIKGVTDAVGALHMTNATGVTYKANIQNGLSVGRFNGTDQSLSNAAISISQPTTFFCVVKYDTTGNDMKLFDGITARQLVQCASNNFQLYADNFASSGVACPTSFAVVVFRFNGASSWVRKNGVQSADIDAGTAALTGLRMGVESGGAVQWFDGDIGEWWACGNVSAGNITAGEAYLASKWNITLA